MKAQEAAELRSHVDDDGPGYCAPIEPVLPLAFAVAETVAPEVLSWDWLSPPESTPEQRRREKHWLTPDYGLNGKAG